MDSYVVRIYRRNPREPRKQAGVVERAGTKDQKVFHDLEGLLAILSTQGPNRPERKALGRHKKQGGRGRKKM